MVDDVVKMLGCAVVALGVVVAAFVAAVVFTVTNTDDQSALSREVEGTVLDSRTPPRHRQAGAAGHPPSVIEHVARPGVRVRHAAIAWKPTPLTRYSPQHNIPTGSVRVTTDAPVHTGRLLAGVADATAGGVDGTTHLSAKIPTRHADTITPTPRETPRRQ